MTTDLRPADTAMLRDMVAMLADRKVATEIVGAGTKRAIGRPTNAEYRLDLSKLAGIRDYEPNELVLTCGAATPLWVLENALESNRQQLAFEPPDYGPLLGLPAGRGTIGGVLSANLSGPRRFKAGAARDHFLGVEAVSGRGESFKAGGKVVKNVTGYDLCKLLAGSWGTVALLGEVTVKVLPAPEDTQTLVLRGQPVEDAVAAMTLALQSPHEISGAAWLPESGETLLRIEGFPESVKARLAATRALLAGKGREQSVLDAGEGSARWQAIRDVSPLQLPADRPVWRLSLPPASAPAVWRELVGAVGLAGYLDWGGGLLWLAVDPNLADGGAAAIRQAVAANGGGHATLIRGSAGLRSGISVFPPLSAGLTALQQRIKTNFDPHDILNRGRFAGSL
ncbi:MAG: glycolate oxidase subunit GlcE [Alphaproteobacteria bacterium]|nr:glycolate oxidase subunit GlcE [Alphaproteobacteria bacterium]MCB9929769.1 glycolate oxidase subunit GlcE [Alphaproteobacteria bacterium]